MRYRDNGGASATMAMDKAVKAAKEALDKHNKAQNAIDFFQDDRTVRVSLHGGSNSFVEMKAGEYRAHCLKLKIPSK